MKITNSIILMENIGWKICTMFIVMQKKHFFIILEFFILHFFFHYNKRVVKNKILESKAFFLQKSAIRIKISVGSFRILSVGIYKVLFGKEILQEILKPNIQFLRFNEIVVLDGDYFLCFKDCVNT